MEEEHVRHFGARRVEGVSLSGQALAHVLSRFEEGYRPRYVSWTGR